MSMTTRDHEPAIARRFTADGTPPESQVEWTRRDARLVDHRDGSVAFEQVGVEVPAGWSQNATNILAQKYFRGSGAERESSLMDVVSRIVDRITSWGVADGYFADDDEASAFSDELRYLLYTQRAAFNSPVWFNIGVDDVPQQASACFILSVEDDMASILNWYREEGVIFKGGSGAGVNLSAVRGSVEPLNGGGSASGPVSFMRGADASAGTIKSGGKTRRAAKMVILDVDHPDIEEFVWCKAHEERKARALAAAGFDMSLDGGDIRSIQYQNANNSVRVTDDFMQAVVDDADWDLVGRVDGNVVRTVRARDLMAQIAHASWQCADPGIQFDTTINRWHTAAATGRINGSNPCSEYMHLDNSACNLASLNLMRFVGDDGEFDTDAFGHAVDVVFTAQDILVGNADYPTESIARTSRDFRQLGLGYANLGALLMAQGLAYDSAGGRAMAGALTALMTGRAYACSTRLAARLGGFAGYDENREHMLGVLNQHRQAVEGIDSALVPPALFRAASDTWHEVCTDAPVTGVRNSQATVLAPTGTIGLLMDCDTTGIEPDLGLVKTKQLVGGGTMSIVNATVPQALRTLGYDADQVSAICGYIDEHGTVVGAPELRADDLAVFATSMGDNTIHYRGHLGMMAAVQPFLSGAISKTVNLPESATVQEVEELLVESWKLGLKAVAIYRDNCKVDQPLSAASSDEPVEPATDEVEVKRAAPVRKRLPRHRSSHTFEFRVADCKGFATIGEYDDGTPGELFISVSKQGSTLAGIMDAFAISVSHGLQYGVPLKAFVKAYVGMRFEPAGMTDDPELRIASSLMDYLFRRLAVRYLSFEEREALHILTTDERTQPTLPGVEETVTESRQGTDIPPDPVDEVEDTIDLTEPGAAIGQSAAPTRDAPMCMQCGVVMQRAGSCFVCTSCGSTSGCS